MRLLSCFWRINYFEAKENILLIIFEIDRRLRPVTYYGYVIHVFPRFVFQKIIMYFFFFFWVFFHTNDSRGSSEIATARAFLVRKHLQDNLCHINFEESSLTKTLFWRMGFLRLQVTTGNFGISEKVRKELKWAISIRSFWKLKQTKYSHQW